MIFETIAIISAIAGLGALACLSLSGIRNWLRQRSANRYGELIKKQLANGNVEVIAIGLTANGTRTGSKTWQAKSLDSELARTFGSSNTVRISV